MLNSDLVKSCTTNTCDFYVCRGMPLLLSHWQINFKHFLYQFKLLEADDGVIPSVTTKALKKNPVAMDIPMNNPTASAIIKSCTILIFQSKNPVVLFTSNTKETASRISGRLHGNMEWKTVFLTYLN